MAGEADIGIRIFLDNAASGGLGQINQQLATMGRMLSSGSGGFAAMIVKMAPLIGLAAGIGASFLLFGAAILYSVRQGMQLQDALALISINVQGAGSNMQALTASIIAIADASTFSATDIAKGTVQLGQMGFTAKQLLQDNSGLITSFTHLAEATGSETVPAALLLGAAMEEFHLKASQAADTANKLDFAFHNGQPSITGLTEALRQVAPVASLLNIPLGDVLISLDMLGKAGILGSTAGLDLRYAMQNMVNPTAKAATEMEHLGIVAYNQTTPALRAAIDALAASGPAGATAAAAFVPTVAGLQAIFTAGQKAGTIPLKDNFIQWAMSVGALNDKLFTASGQFKGLKNLLDTLAGSLKGMSDQAKITDIGAIFGVRASQGALTLANNIITLDQNWNSMSARMKDTSAQNDANAITSTLSGTLKMLTTTIQNIAALVGMAFQPALTGLAASLNNLLSYVTQAGMGMGKAGAIFLTVGFSLSSLGVVALIVASAFTPLGAAILTIVGVAAAVVAGTIILSAVITALITHANQVRGVFIGLGVVVAVAAAAFAGFQAAQMLAVFVQLVPLVLALAGEYVGLAVDMGIAALASIRQFIATSALVIVMAAGMIPTLMAAAGAWLLEAAAMMIAAAPFILFGVLVAGAVLGLIMLVQHLGGLNMLLNLGRAIWASLLPVFAQAGAAIRGAFLQALQQLQPVWQQLMQSFNQARPMLIALGTVLGAVIAGAIAVLVGALRGGIMAFSALLIAVIHVAAGLIQAFAGVLQFFMGFFTVLHGLFTLNGAEIQAGFRTMGAGVLNIVTGLWNAVKAVFIGGFQIIVGFVTGFVQGVIGFFHMLSSVLVGHSIVPDMMTAIRAVFVGGFAAIVGLVHAGIAVIVSVFTAMATAVSAAVTFAMSVLRALFTGGIAAAVAVVAGGVASIISHFASMPGPIGGFVRGAIAVVQTMSGAIMGVAGAIGGAVGRIVGVFQGMAGGIAGAISGAIGWIHNLMGAASGIGGTLHALHVPGFATGGIVTSPTLAVVGEGSEPEIILPMSQYQAAMQGAANAATAAANRPTTGGDGGTSITNLYIDSRLVATATLNRLTGQLQTNGMGRMLQ